MQPRHSVLCKFTVLCRLNMQSCIGRIEPTEEANPCWKSKCSHSCHTAKYTTSARTVVQVCISLVTFPTLPTLLTGTRIFLPAANRRTRCMAARTLTRTHKAQWPPLNCEKYSTEYCTAKYDPSELEKDGGRVSFLATTLPHQRHGMASCSMPCPNAPILRSSTFRLTPPVRCTHLTGHSTSY